jgi:hypothetical protein
MDAGIAAEYEAPVTGGKFTQKVFVNYPQRIE